jgi:hypothetical protein
MLLLPSDCCFPHEMFISSIMSNIYILSFNNNIKNGYTYETALRDAEVGKEISGVNFT